MDLDARIRNADPASGLIVTTTDVAAPRCADRRDLGAARRRGQWMVAAGATLVLMAAALWLSGSLRRGEGTGKPISAAGAVLVRAGRSATRGAAAVRLGRGEYFYDEVKALVGGFYALGSGGPADMAYVVQPETIQTWGGADGSDVRVTTYDGPQTFMTHGANGWVLGGAWTLAPPAGTRYSASTPWGQTVEFGGPGALLAVPDDLSRLPTSAAALAHLIDTNETGLNEVVTDPSLPASAAYTFSTAAEILAAPAFGSSAALRVAFCKLMASVPGIELLGPATDESGRRGIAIAGPLGGDGYGEFAGDRGVREEVIIDPADGGVLQLAQVVADPSRLSREFRKVIGHTTGQVFDWTDYLASGIVHSATATLAAQPTQTPTE
jgi:hypothetical protein